MAARNPVRMYNLQGASALCLQDALGTPPNFVRVHKTLRVMPAMTANVTKRLWEMSDIVNVLEAWEANAA